MTSQTTMSSDMQRQFMYLFERIGEPLYFGPRGEGTNLTFYNLPMDMCPETNHASMIYNQGFSNMRMNEVKVERPGTMPNLMAIGQACSKSSIYNYFNPNHRRAVRDLRQILLQQNNLQGLLNMACACRDSEMVNPKVWINAFASCLLNRPDTRGFKMPAVWEIMPDMFFSPFCLRQGTRQGALPTQDRGVIVVDSSFTGRDSNAENRLAYFREDMGINAHHWHWHLIYTLDAPRGQRDRKGELFYYMHHEMLARYEAERLGNGLPRTRPLVIEDALMKEGYFPKLTDGNSSQLWGNRQQETKLTDIHRLDDNNLPQGLRTVTLEMLKKFKDRIFEAIDSGRVLLPDGRQSALTIDILGDMVEAASALTPNGQYYGDQGLHNMGHVMIAYSHDPEFKHRENSGVMGDTTTAMRDPIFYRWHRYIDNIFNRFKENLQPYNPTGGELQLVWSGIQVESIGVQRDGEGVQANTLSTFRMRSHVDLARGLDFLRTSNNLGAVFTRLVHLNHDPYTFTITVRNNTNGERAGTVRIYLAPRLNEHNEVLPLVQQRRLFFELDKFTTQLRPGMNTIRRRSTESSVTIPWEQTFRDLERTIGLPPANESTFCGCGWPQHMNIPRGTPSGQLFDLVIFITNGQEDQVTQTTPSSTRTTTCRDAVSYCGILDQLYPDSKPMGYPWDRNPYTAPSASDPNGPQVPVPDLATYVSRVPNMRTIQVRVVYDQQRVEMRDDNVPAGMREINGDPNMTTSASIVCPDSGQSPRTDPRTPTTPNGNRPGVSTPSSMEISPSRDPKLLESSSRINSVRERPPQNWGQQTWGTQYPQRGRQQQQSRPESPTGWTHIPSPPRPSSPNNWGWGWRG